MMPRSGPETLDALALRLEKLCDDAQENHCPNDPPCTEDAPLEVGDWCAVCLLVTDVKAILDEQRTPQETNVPKRAETKGET